MNVITRDGKELARVATHDDACIWLLKHQSSSVDHALKYEGYEIKEVKE